MFLYKYLTPKKASDWLIKEDSLLLTPPIYLNDVLEFRIRREQSDSVETGAMFSKFQQENPTDLLLDDFENSIGSVEFRSKEADDMQRRHSEITGVLSLTSDPLSELMWAHYGLNSGVALGYAAEEETECQSITARRTILGAALKVEYGDEQMDFKKDFSNAPRLFTRKRECWSYEHEWRLIHPLKKARKIARKEKIFYTLSAEKEHIKHLVFGINAKPEFRSEMVAWLGRTSSKIQVVTIDPETNLFSLTDCMT